MSRILGIARSLLMYHGAPWRAARLRRFYAALIPPASLCFDIGAHVGSRVRAWRALGARIVAVEPQPDFVAILNTLYGHDSRVTIVSAALGAREGEATLLVSERTPTVTTLSRDWILEVQRDPGFRGVAWKPGNAVPVITLQQLIDRYGIPDFVKIDVEGYEAEVLHGLDTALPCVSFEYLPAARQVALQCLERLAKLGNYHYNWSVGESHRLADVRWCSREEIHAIIESLSLRAGSGDVYARLEGTPNPARARSGPVAP